MHHIQLHILKVLVHVRYARFRDMRPPRVDSNAYSYHLKTLQREKFVEKTEQGYRLASKGLSLVDSLHSDDLRPRNQPKLIAIIAVHDGVGKWLLAERKIQPFIGAYMFISGGQHRGENLAEHAVRELYDKTGLSSVPLTLRGIADIQIYSSEKLLLTHVFANVYEGVASSSSVPPETAAFKFGWHDFGTIKSKVMPGTVELYDKLREREFFQMNISAVYENH